MKTLRLKRHFRSWASTAILFSLVLNFFFYFLPGPLAHAEPLDPRFGIVEAFWYPDWAEKSGAGWERIVFWWSSLQPGGPDEWNVDHFPDHILDQELNRGMEVVGLLVNTPSWANGTNDPRVPPKNLYLPHTDPNNYWARFVKKAVERNKGKIKYWVIWNEPDVWDLKRPGSTWAGTEADYYQLLKVAYLSAKEADPNVKILFAGMTYWWDKQYGRELYFKRVLDIMAQDPTAPTNNYYFDIAVLHLYNVPQNLYSTPQLFHQIMRAHGFDKPVWINEFNVTPHDDPAAPLPRQEYRASLDEQASFIIQSTALALASGVERIAIYKMKDDVTLVPGSEAFGLVRNDYTPRPAFEAYRVITRYFAGYRSAKWVTNRHLNAVVINRGQETTTVLWNLSPQEDTVVIPALGTSARLIDKLGKEREIIADAGKYTIKLPGATANTVTDKPGTYVIGGSPFLLVEQGQRIENLILAGDEEYAKAEAARKAEEEKKRLAEERKRREEEQKRIEEERRKAEYDRLKAQIPVLLTNSQTLGEKGDWEGSLSAANQVLSVEPENSKAQTLGKKASDRLKAATLRKTISVQIQKEDWRAAESSLEDLIQLDPGDPGIGVQQERVKTELKKLLLLEESEQHIKGKQWKAATETLRKLLDLEANHSLASRNLAFVRWHRLDWIQPYSWLIKIRERVIQ